MTVRLMRKPWAIAKPPFAVTLDATALSCYEIAMDETINETQLLIIGAGPYGLSTASYAKRLGMDLRVLGEPMGFWKDNMPGGMLLRSPTSWHLDPLAELTFERFLEQRGITPGGGLLLSPSAFTWITATGFRKRVAWRCSATTSKTWPGRRAPTILFRPRWTMARLFALARRWPPPG